MSDTAMPEAVADRVIRSVKITFLTTALSGLVQFAIMVVLGRILGPPDYGTFAAIFALGAMTTGLVSGVFERSLIVSPEPKNLNGSVFVMMFVALAISTLVFGGVWLADEIGGLGLRGELVAMQLAALTIASCGIIPRVMLRREIRFGRLAISNLAGQITGTGLTAIVLAYCGFGVYALLAGSVVQNLVTVLVLLQRHSRRLFWPPRLEAISRTLPRAYQLAKIASIEVAFERLPIIVIGSTAGIVGAGLFNRAFALIQLPLELLTTSMTRVMISGLAAVQDDVERLQRGMRTLTLVASAIILPVAAGVAGSRQQFTAVALGPSWAKAAELLPFLATTASALMVAHLFAVLAESTLRLREKVRIHSLSTFTMVIAMFIGGRYSLTAGVACLTLSSILYFVLYLALGSRILKLRYSTPFSWLLPGLGAATLALICTSAISTYWPGHSPLLVLTVQIVTCALSTLFYYSAFHSALLAEIVGLVIPRRFLLRRA
jgi:lipopolysaccharide exporter